MEKIPDIMANKPRTFRPSHLPSREDATRQYDHDRDQQPWRRWYKTARWQKLRADQLAEEPLCRNCMRHGRITAATVCDHVDRHGGDPNLFWIGPFQSLCDQAPWRCHSSAKQSEERQDRGGGSKVQTPEGLDRWVSKRLSPQN